MRSQLSLSEEKVYMKISAIILLISLIEILVADVILRCGGKRLIMA